MNANARFCRDCSRVVNEIDGVYCLDRANVNDDDESAMIELDYGLRMEEFQSKSNCIDSSLHLPGSSLAMLALEECDG